MERKQDAPLGKTSAALAARCNIVVPPLAVEMMTYVPRELVDLDPSLIKRDTVVMSGVKLEDAGSIRSKDVAQQCALMFDQIAKTESEKYLIMF